MCVLTIGTFEFANTTLICLRTRLRYQRSPPAVTLSKHTYCYVCVRGPTRPSVYCMMKTWWRWREESRRVCGGGGGAALMRSSDKERQSEEVKVRHLKLQRLLWTRGEWFNTCCFMSVRSISHCSYRLKTLHVRILLVQKINDIWFTNCDISDFICSQMFQNKCIFLYACKMRNIVNLEFLASHWKSFVFLYLFCFK